VADWTSTLPDLSIWYRNKKIQELHVNSNVQKHNRTYNNAGGVWETKRERKARNSWDRGKGRDRQPTVGDDETSEIGSTEVIENSHSCQGACCNDETGKALQAERPLKELKAADWGDAAEVDLRSKLLELAIDAAIAITISKALPRTLSLSFSLSLSHTMFGARAFASAKSGRLWDWIGLSS
jgi:hypothetical protein